MPMNAVYRGPIDLPHNIPVFPLPGALLLPRGQMPLNIFEPRYLAMIDDSLREAPLFYGTFLAMTAIAALLVASAIATTWFSVSSLFQTTSVAAEASMGNASRSRPPTTPLAKRMRPLSTPPAGSA